MREKQLSFDQLWKDDNYQTEKVQQKERTQSAKTNGSADLVNDIAYLLTYIEEQTIILTQKKGVISGKDLLDINKRVSIQADEVTIHSRQEHYPYIQLLYHLIIAGGLVEVIEGKGKRKSLKTTEKEQLFHQLTATEQYFFLLETFWVDIQWSVVQRERNGLTVTQLTELLASVITQGEKMKLKVDVDVHKLLLYLEWFGFWVCQRNDEAMTRYGGKNAFYASGLTLTDFGRRVIPILLFKRNMQVWNIDYRRTFGEFNPIPGAPFDFVMVDGLSFENDDKLDYYATLDQSEEDFLEPFKELYSNKELQKTLPRKFVGFVHGLYTFKVSCGESVWRKIVLSAEETMDILHQMIMEAFQFDDDHLYTFFMDGTMWSDYCLVSPFEDSGNLQTTEIQVGAVGLSENQRFLYLFDYGDEWLFTVEVSAIDSTVKDVVTPYIESEYGVAPRQYEEW